MSRAGEHREPGTGETDEVACHAATEQAKQLYCVLRTDDIGIPDDEQGGGLDRPYGLGWPSDCSTPI